MFFRWAQEWSVFESPLWPPILLCPTHNLHTWTHTLSSFSTSISLVLSIDCYNQTTGCSQVIWECYAIFPLIQPMLVGILPLYAQPGHTENGDTGKRLKKRQTQKHHSGKTDLVGGRVKPHKQERKGKMQKWLGLTISSFILYHHTMQFFSYLKERKYFFLAQRDKWQ